VAAARGHAPTLPSLRLHLAEVDAQRSTLNARRFRAERRASSAERRIPLRAGPRPAIATAGGGTPQPRPERRFVVARATTGALPTLPGPVAGRGAGAGRDGCGGGEGALKTICRSGMGGDSNVFPPLSAADGSGQRRA